MKSLSEVFLALDPIWQIAFVAVLFAALALLFGAGAAIVSHGIDYWLPIRAVRIRWPKRSAAVRVDTDDSEYRKLLDAIQRGAERRSGERSIRVQVWP